MWCRDAIQALLASRFERHSLCSRSAEVALLGIDRVSTFQQLKGTGAAFMHWLGVLAINQCARRLLCLPQPGGCLPEVLFTMRMQVFDETPSTLSVSVATDEIVNARHEDARTVKVFQFRTTFTVLYKIADTIFEVVLPVPSHMQSADRNTAEVVMRLLDSWFDIPGLFSLEDAASYRLQLIIADRGSQNVKATRLWSESCPLDGKDNELTLWCTTHGAATALKASASLCGQLVSGCISIALAARPAGAITLLRDILYWFIRSRLCLRRGTPPEDSDAQNRRAVCNTFIPNGPPGSMTHTRLKAVEALWTGSLRTAGIFVWIPHGVVVVPGFLTKMVKEAVSQLVPAQVPLFPKHRWTGIDQTLDCLGLISSLNGGIEVFSVWAEMLKSGKRPSALTFKRPECPTDIVNDCPSALKQPLIMAELVAASDCPALADGEGVDNGNAPTVHAEPHKDDMEGWRKFHKQQRTNVAAFASSLPAADLLCFRISIEPVATLIRDLLKIGAEVFMLKQAISESTDITAWRNDLSKYRQFAASKAVGQCLNRFQELLGEGTKWSACRPNWWSSDQACFAFRLLSRGAGCVAKVLGSKQFTYPHLLLSIVGNHALAGAVEADCPRRFDAFTVRHLHVFRGRLADPESLAILTSILRSAGVGVVPIENDNQRLNAIKRKLSTTNSPKFSDVSEDAVYVRRVDQEKVPWRLEKANVKRCD